jgi:hypothetical protein
MRAGALAKGQSRKVARCAGELLAGSDPVGCSGTSDYPPDLQEEATKTVLAQAELLCADWAA